MNKLMETEFAPVRVSQNEHSFEAYLVSVLV